VGTTEKRADPRLQSSLRDSGHSCVAHPPSSDRASHGARAGLSSNVPPGRRNPSQPVCNSEGGAQGCENGWAFGPTIALPPPRSRRSRGALWKPYRVRGPIEIADPGRRCAGPGLCYLTASRFGRSGRERSEIAVARSPGRCPRCYTQASGRKSRAGFTILPLFPSPGVYACGNEGKRPVPFHFSPL
jgi:hypothetical protein